MREQLFVRRAAEVVLARKDGEVVGFALFFHNFSTFLGKPGLYLEDLYVRPRWRGRGVGTALLAEAVDRARKAGCHKMALQVWPHNAAAIALYERFGFQREGYLTRHYRRRSGELWDAVIMGLRLD